MGSQPTPTRSAVDLLNLVSVRLGVRGELTIRPEPGDVCPRVEVRWRRSYDGVLSDERCIETHGLVEALEAVLLWEDEADAEEGRRP